MRIKSRRNLPVRFTFLIRIFLVFIVSSALLSIYGLNFEKKISNIYEEIDEINLEKKYFRTFKKQKRGVTFINCKCNFKNGKFFI